MTTDNKPETVTSEYLRGFFAVAGLDKLPLDERVYHYTDADGLLGILSSKSLRGGHVAFLNDTTEYQFGKSRVLNVLKALDTEHQELVRHVMYVVWARYEGQEVFVASFCEDPDLVPQWRGYGGAGSGYSLGFDAARLARGGALFGPVIYGESAVTAAASATLDAATKALRALGRPTEAKVGDILTSLAVVLLMLAVCSKDDIFSYEREYRLVYIVTRESGGALEHPKSILFRSRSGLVVPFVPLPLPTHEGGSLALESVWVGPTQVDEAAHRGLALLLDSCGLGEVSITQSAAPVRFL